MFLHFKVFFFLFSLLISCTNYCTSSISLFLIAVCYFFYANNFYKDLLCLCLWIVPFSSLVFCTHNIVEIKSFFYLAVLVDSTYALLNIYFAWYFCFKCDFIWFVQSIFQLLNETSSNELDQRVRLF